MVEPTVFPNGNLVAVSLLEEIVDVLVVEPNHGLAETKVLTDIFLGLALPYSFFVVVEAEFRLGRMDINPTERLELEQMETCLQSRGKHDQHQQAEQNRVYDV